jgi:hypothetical protein
MALAAPGPHTTPFFLPPEDPSAVLLRPNSIRNGVCHCVFLAHQDLQAHFPRALLLPEELEDGFQHLLLAVDTPRTVIFKRSVRLVVRFSLSPAPFGGAGAPPPPACEVSPLTRPVMRISSGRTFVDLVSKTSQFSQATCHRNTLLSARGCHALLPGTGSRQKRWVNPDLEHFAAHKQKHSPLTPLRL